MGLCNFRWPLAVALCLWIGAGAQAATFRPGRVSDVSGTLSVRGEDEDDVSTISLNAVLRDGDVLWTDRASNVELEVQPGSWLRLSESTKLEVRTLTGDPELRLWTGSVYVDLSERQERSVRVDTPGGDLEVNPGAVARVDLGGDENARISVYHGSAHVTPAEGAALDVRASERVYLTGAHVTEGPSHFDTDDLDGFDQYQRQRVDYYLDRPVPRELKRDLPGARELDRYGTWVEVERDWYWRPTCGPDWRPYSTGYWSVVPGWGYTWVDYEPWGYTTCHYGRWMYRPAYGWLWWPGYTWAPSSVYWASYGDYYGWCPLDPWDRPCYWGPGSFVVIGIVFDSRSWTFCHRDRFFYGRHHLDHLDGRHAFFTPDHLRIHSGEKLHLNRDVYGEIGIPRDHVRGLTVAKDGRRAFDHVLDVDRTIPTARRNEIRRRFGVDPDRDRNAPARTSDAERMQRGPGIQIDPKRILRGDDAKPKLNRLPTRREGPTERPGTPGTGTTRPGGHTPLPPRDTTPRRDVNPPRDTTPRRETPPRRETTPPRNTTPPRDTTPRYSPPPRNNGVPPRGDRIGPSPVTPTRPGPSAPSSPRYTVPARPGNSGLRVPQPSVPRQPYSPSSPRWRMPAPSAPSAAPGGFRSPRVTPQPQYPGPRGPMLRRGSRGGGGKAAGGSRLATSTRSGRHGHHRSSGHLSHATRSRLGTARKAHSATLALRPSAPGSHER